MIITATTTRLVESPLLSNGHGGFGKRPEETGRPKGQHRASGRLREHWQHLRTTNPIKSTFATRPTPDQGHQGARLTRGRARDEPPWMVERL